MAELLALVRQSPLTARPDSALGRELLLLATGVHQRREAACVISNAVPDRRACARWPSHRAILDGRAKGAPKVGSARMFPLLLLGVFLFALQDPQYRVFYATGAGQLLLALVVGLMAWGYRLIGRAIEEVG